MAVEEKNNDLRLSSAISIQHRTESQWVLTITSHRLKEADNNENNPSSLVSSVKQQYIKGKDDCVLLRHAIINGRLTLKVYCNTTDDDNDQEENDEQPLHYTINHLRRIFGLHNVIVNKNVIVSHPNYWYGRPEFLTEERRRGKNKKDKAKWQRERQSFSLGAKQPWTNLIAVNPTWGRDRIDQREDILDNEYHYYNAGSDIDVYVIDTGVLTTHVDFGGRAFFLTNTIDGQNEDCNGHGTHVSGIIGSATYGVAPNVTIFGVKVLDCSGNGDLFTIDAGVSAVIENVQQREGSGSPKTKRSVVNLSLGGSKSTLLEQSVMALSYNGIVTTVSAGNLGSDACYSSPAALGGLNNNNYILSVGASDIYDVRPQWSNYGSCVSLSAPGVGIKSLWIGSNTATRTISGTSMAAPFVAGVSAIMLQDNKELTNVEVNTIMLTRGITPNTVQSASSQGGGKNLLFSLFNETAIPPPPPPPPFMAPFFTSDGTTAKGYSSSFSLLALLLAAVFLM